MKMCRKMTEWCNKNEETLKVMVVWKKCTRVADNYK